MNARARQEYEHRSVLRDNGWSVSQRDSVAFNGGATESLEHWLCKCLVAYALKDDGFRVASEVEGPDGQEADIIAYGTEDPPVVVECETGLTDDVKSKKLGQHVRGTPLRDCLFVEVEDLPERIDDAYAFVQGEL